MSASQNRILEATERVILRDGVAHLTLEAVAAEASLSKGGVLYHFRTKEDLIRGMITRLQELFEHEMDRLAAADPCPKGRRTRAYLHTSFPLEPSEFSVRTGQVAAALLAAVATNRELLRPIYERGKVLDALLREDGIAPAAAIVVRLAADGLWLNGLFGVPPLEPELQRAVVLKLQEITESV